ncbi:hypothetical protein JCM10908_003168 [Rhodotorula pacifica]|uniref:rhomboid family protein n=1 Tax=Rhodotorula pacifica TaxID=1495444 RepID=UPI00316ED8B5
MQPSLLYARPQPPSDAGSENFQWGDDAASTIAPEDSVSQLDRRFTGKRRVLGPRAMETSPAIPEDGPVDEEVEALRDVYVAPERIGAAGGGASSGSSYQQQRQPYSSERDGRRDEDDQTTAVPTSSSRRTGAMRAVNPSSSSMAGTGGPLARARGEVAPVPYSSPSMYDDEAEHGFPHAGAGGEDASHPLVASDRDRSGGGIEGGSSGGSRIAPYLSRSQQTKGYAALGEEGGDEVDDEAYGGAGRYTAYERSRAGEGGAGSSSLPDAREAGPGVNSGSTGSSALVGALSNPLGYFKRSIRGVGGDSASQRRDSSFYMPNELAFDPPPMSSAHHNDDKYPPSAPYSSSGGHYPSASLDKMPSIDIVPAQDGSFGPLDSSSRNGRGAGTYYDPNRAGARGEMIEPAPLWRRWFWDTTDPERRVWEHKTGRGMQRWPFASWTLAVIMTIVLIVELVRMKSITGSLIQTKPSFNVMIGPSAEVLINQGARFAGCMKYIPDVTNIAWTCPNATNSNTVSSSLTTCTMSDVCGFGGFDSQTDGPGGPNQSFRFFVPIFLHAGIVHLLFNMVAQCTSSALVEKMMGTPSFLVLYFAAGIAGFVLGANFALVGQPSVGASGAIFGTQAALLIDLLAHWKIEYRPKRKLLMLVVEVIIGFGLGWVPGIDNFAHLGGFAMGLLVSLLLFPIIHPSRAHKLTFAGLRIVVLPLIIVFYVVLVRNFYTSDPATACSWCRYLSCWPTASNNHCKGTGLSTYSTSSTTISSLLTILVSTFVVPLL